MNSDQIKQAQGIKLLVSIVTYKTNFNDLIQTITSLDESVKFASDNNLDLHCELVLIDNNSGKTYCEQLTEMINTMEVNHLSIKTIENSKNLGYGSAHNIVLNENSTYNLVLNPDVILSKDTLKNAIDKMGQQPEVGLLSPSVFGVDGERHYLCKTDPTLFIMFLRSFAPGFLKSIFNDKLFKYELRDKDYNKEIKNCSYLTGCFMFFKTEVFKKIKGFDENFFMYLEDADISRRVLGCAQTLYDPSVKIIHKWERGSHKKIKLTIYSIISSFYYSLKWMFRR